MNSGDARVRWERTWGQLGERPPQGVVEELLAAYSEPHRAYHTLQHLGECFEHLDSYPLAPEAPAALELALWFHDVVYDPRSTSNESDSAEWCMRALAGLEATLLDVVRSSILVTKHDTAPRTADERLVLDIDLAILGAPRERFDEYEAQIRCEYAWVPEDAYRIARLDVLRGFQQRSELYHTAYFRHLLGAPARANLARTIERLAV